MPKPTPPIDEQTVARLQALGQQMAAKRKALRLPMPGRLAI